MTIRSWRFSRIPFGLENVTARLESWLLDLTFVRTIVLGSASRLPSTGSFCRTGSGVPPLN